MLLSSFVEYFFEQQAYVMLIVLAAPAALLVAVLAAATFLLRARVDHSAVRPVLIATAVTLAFAVVGITVFEAAALYLRHVPHGSGLERRGASLDVFYRWSELAFFSLYAALVLVGAVLGHACAHVRRVAVTVATAAAVSLYLVVTLPLVAYANACNVGKPLVTNAYIEC